MRMRWIAAVVMMGLGAGPAHAGELTFSGKVFSDLTFKQNVDGATGATSKDSGFGFDLKRFYLTADYVYDPLISARLRTDIGDLNGKYDVFVKSAYVQLAFSKAFWLRAGAADLPWTIWLEDRYAFRYVDNLMMDRTGFGGTSDWGLHVGGELASGLASYQVSVVNGRGYTDPTRSQAPTVEARVSTEPMKGLSIGVGGLVGALGQKRPGVPLENVASRVQGAVTYVTPLFRVGAEAFYGQNDTKVAVAKGPEDSALGFSGWGAVQLSRRLLQPTVFARIDWVQPSRDVNPDLKNTYFNAGLQVTPWEPLRVALVYKRDQVSTGAVPGTFKTSNGTIGSASPDSDGTFQEVGVFSQFLF